ncbi:radical SAM protein [Pleomorphomonas sp. JP5]|uniref:radical SAM protein n=1 Tax=Pleomorphomonas sp. JP5 TaxID=2942998 RepID=UPI0020449EE0|nr:radical SAM protein [Pleomorphomonas sp. JP5]MCM5557051.1 radical SAM protein [Pleomorphomonas sp. JP5]
MADVNSDRPDRARITDTPFIYLFGVSDRDFVLDINTNRLFSLEEDEAALLREWQAGASYPALAARYPAANEAIDALRAEGAFDVGRAERLAYGCDFETISRLIASQRSRTVLEVTQACNLRCRYCTFGGGFPDHRTHSLKRMDPTVLEKAIAAALRDGSALEEVCIAFYGGEPMLAFDLIERGVAFARAEAGGKRLRFSTTTNGTLLDADKAGFLAEHGFSVLVSIDGPKGVHDTNRIFRDGRGSYDDGIRGLKALLQAYPPDAHGKIGLSMVIPSSNWLPVLERLWDDEPWLPRSLRVMVSDVNAPEGFVPAEPAPGADYEAFRQGWIADRAAARPGRTQIETSVFDRAYARLHHRPTEKPDAASFYPNGCCIPGVTKVYVDVDGAYKICERSHGTPDIGSVDDGVRLDRVKQVIEAYGDGSIADCATCEVVSLCNACFANAFVNGRFDIAAKRKWCATARPAMKRRLQGYADLVQRPEFAARWDEYTFTN